jgi:signal transduction histidine kinase
VKQVYKILFLILLPFSIRAQLLNIDSLQNVLHHSQDSEQRFMATRFIYSYYEERNRDSAFYYGELGEQIARNSNHKIAEHYCAVMKSYQLMNLGRYGDALQNLQQAFVIAGDSKYDNEPAWDMSAFNFKGNNRLLLLSVTHHMLALLMIRTDNVEQQIVHFKEAGRIARQIDYVPRYMLADMNLGQSYLRANKLDSALLFEKQAEQTVFQSSFKKYLGNIDLIMGDIYKVIGDQTQSLQYYYYGVKANLEQNNLASLSRVYLRLTRHHLDLGNKDSALYYAKKNMEIIQSLGMIASSESNMGVCYENMYLSYRLNNQFDSAFKYQGLALIAKDSLNKLTSTNLTKFHNLTFQEQLRLQNVENEKIAFQNKIRIWFLLAGIAVLLLLAVIFFRNNKQQQRAKQKIEQAYHDLKATQQQLVHAEKMASLGELTAGIAHEIQNPLNFVNNFSEVSNELVEEMQQELAIGNGQLAIEIARDVKQNLEKINHHGKRADAIVKSMLQHSRSSTGKKEPTDINALADEYLRLAYHGMRAKDKSFSAKFETSLDNSIGKVNVVPQEIGRVILNLINNAFYAVTEKNQKLDGSYEPCVAVSTRKQNGKIEIEVKDNGGGIPQKVLDKIFQPFFTTKPTGEGTGLGLSLSYDIISKGHGGELKIETKEGEGSSFIIQLPNQSN